MPIMKIEAKWDNEIKIMWSLVGINYGFIADIDINSEFLRFLGNLWFEIYAYFKIICPN